MAFSGALPSFPGQCWLSMNGGEEPVLLGAGDFVVLPHGRGGGDCFALSALFTFDGYGASFLLGVLSLKFIEKFDTSKNGLRG
jgi:hypothetical protein